MKELLKKSLTKACVMFTIFMLIGSLIAIAFTGPQQGLIMTLTLMLAAIAFAFLQSLWFTDKLIKHLTYPLRIFGFGVTAFAVLLGCAWLGSWFPMDNPGAWITFTAIYLVILVLCCIGYQIYFKRTVGSFDEALRHYHEKMGR